MLAWKELESVIKLMRVPRGVNSGCTPASPCERTEHELQLRCDILDHVLLIRTDKQHRLVVIKAESEGFLRANIQKHDTTYLMNRCCHQEETRVLNQGHGEQRKQKDGVTKRKNDIWQAEMESMILTSSCIQ